MYYQPYQAVKQSKSKVVFDKKKNVLKPPVNCFSYGVTPEIWGVFDAMSPEDRRLCVLFLKQNVAGICEEASLPEFQDHLQKLIGLDKEMERRIAGILVRFVKAQEGISRQEIGFLRKLWDEFQLENEQKVGAPM